MVAKEMLVLSLMGILSISFPLTEGLSPGMTGFVAPVVIDALNLTNVLSNQIIMAIIPALANLKPVNYTGPDKLEKLTDNFLNGILENDLTPACRYDTQHWLMDVLSGKAYALKMLDSFGKLPSGISRGNILWFGSYDMCLAVQGPRKHCTTGGCQILGGTEPAANYCLVRLTVKSVELPTYPAFGVCLPKTCTGSDSATFIVSILHIITSLDKLAAVNGTLCQDEIPPQVGNKAALILIGFFVVICLWATLMHLLFRQCDNRWWNTEAMAVPRPFFPSKRNFGPPTGNKLSPFTSLSATGDTAVGYEMKEVSLNGAGNGMTEFEEYKTKPVVDRKQVPNWIKYIMCFSIIHNSNKIFAPPLPGQLDYLHGIRVLSMWWIILGHIHQLGQNFFDNQLDMIESLKGYAQQLVLNAYFAVDTFFLLSGLVITYTLLREVKQSLNVFSPLFFSYLRRLWRLTPLYMFILLIFLFVVPYIADGPYPILVRAMGSPTENCKTYWWTNLLYISNLFPMDKTKICMQWTWFLSADMQLFWFTPPILAIVIKFPRVGITVLFALIVTAVFAVSSLVSLYGLPLTEPQFHSPINAAVDYNTNYEYIFDKPWTGAICYIVGCLLAVMIVKIKTPPRWRWSIFFAGWIVSFLAAYGALYGIYHGGLEKVQDMSIIERTVFAAFSRPAWALAVGWVIFACQYGYGFAVNRFLSLPIWAPLSRLTYAAYLVHFLVLQIYFTGLRTMIGYGTYQIITIFFSQVVAVYMVAYVASVFLEMPLLRLEQLVLFGRI